MKLGSKYVRIFRHESDLERCWDMFIKSKDYDENKQYIITYPSMNLVIVYEIIYPNLNP